MRWRAPPLRHNVEEEWIFQAAAGEGSMEIGRKILNLRKDQGVHQRDLAHDSHVTPSALSRIEAGIHTPRGKVTLEIARRLGTTADYVLDETAPYPPPAYEILANLTDSTAEEPREIPTVISEREEQVLRNFRKLDLERKRLLEAVLNGTRREVRFAAWILGAELPGADSEELERHHDQLRALSAELSGQTTSAD